MPLCFLFSGKSKEAEIKRINKELANIRSKFKGKARPLATHIAFVRKFCKRDLISESHLYFFHFKSE